MGLQTHFDKFHNKIKLGREDEAYTSARERDDSITKEIKAAFKEAGYAVIDDFIQGSMSTHTAVVSLSGDHDIDRALVIGDEDAPENPVDPKKAALKVLEERGFKNAKIKLPCVTADYSSESVHIDFPIYKKSEWGQHYLAWGKKNSDEDHRKWDDADPKGLLDWIKDTSVYGLDGQKKHDQCRCIVRYLKRYRDHQFSEGIRKKIHSIGLTVMAKQQYVAGFDSDGNREDVRSLKATVDGLLTGGYFSLVSQDRYSLTVSLPVLPYSDIFEKVSEETATQLRNKLSYLSKKLGEAIDTDDVRKQCIILNGLFGSDFVVPDPPKKKSAAKVYPSAGIGGHSDGA